MSFINLFIFSQYCKELLEVSDLMDIERKMDLYKSMFYCNVPGDRYSNFPNLPGKRVIWIQ